uniref:DUF7869 domain-containing protein n=2 Tax=Cacopsylla melanoneura TaxID=428564 RepID=A0A8D9AZS6_9HEMI
MNERELADHEAHNIEKTFVYNRFLTHQKTSKNQKDDIQDTLCVSFDLQKVLTVPHGTSIHYYYSRKFAVYNFTLFESGTLRGINNIWTECDGNRGANEIASIVRNYLIDLDRNPNNQIQRVLFYSDNCCGQNKNRTMISVLFHTLKECEKIKTVQMNYLMVGHTYMPVDSVHSSIEKRSAKCDIQSPNEWVAIIKTSRLKPKPYEVVRLNHTDFLSWDNVTNHYMPKTLRKYESGEPFKITEVCSVTFKSKNNVLEVKNSYLPDAKASNFENAGKVRR